MIITDIGGSSREDDAVEREINLKPEVEVDSKTKESERELIFVWRSVRRLVYIHCAGLYGVYLWLSGQTYWWTVAFNFVIGVMALTGVTAGAHRLWSHKSYKANLPLSILLVIFQTMACQHSAWQWARDHRIHHKFTETDADPHNAKRGFWFSHVGWLALRKLPAVKAKEKTVYMADLERDPVVMFQKKYFGYLTIFLAFIFPWVLPVYFGENPWHSWNSVMARFMLTLNFTWLINSAAHLWGHKPYDKNINPAENKMVSILAVGEGWHNYHHTFPWDYKAAELSIYRYNLAAGFIDFFAWIGWATELKTVPERVVMQRIQRTGDGSHPKHNKEVAENNNNNINGNQDEEVKHSWGWGDQDVSKKEDREVEEILKRGKVE